MSRPLRIEYANAWYHVMNRGSVQQAISHTDEKGLPFGVKIPNKTTLKAMQNTDARKTKKAKNVKELFMDLD